jgi:hypothetical protein
MNAALKLEPREDDPVMQALARAHAKGPTGRPIPPEVQAQIEASRRSMAAGEPCVQTLDEVLDMIANNAREQGYSEAEIQAHVYGPTPAP